MLYIESLLEVYQGIREVNIWDDRPSQAKGFSVALQGLQDDGRIDRYSVSIREGDKELTIEEERSLINLLVEDYLKEFPQKPKREITEFIQYTGVKLSPESKNLLQTQFGAPQGWLKKAGHVTIALGKARRDMLVTIGPIHTRVLLTAVAWGQSDLAMAVEVQGVPSINQRVGLPNSFFAVL